MNVIEIENLVKTYGDNVAVNNLNLSIEKGKVYGFLGPNGAGKSTTMNIITGYIGGTKGTVRIEGHDVFKEPEEAKKRIGYLPEIPPLYPDMIVKEYLEFVAELKQIPKKYRKNDIDKALDMTQTEQVKNRLIRNLSKGYKQRVGIAQAIMGMPEVIILDEPTVGLDPKQIIEIRQLIKELGKKHTVILSSHILPEISEVCDKIFIISEGKLVASGTEKELVEEMAGENVLNIKIKGDTENIEKVLSDIKGEISYQMKKDDIDNVIDVTIATDRMVDLRERLFYGFADKKLPILEMNFKRKTLEDIFIEITKEYVAPVKKKGIRLGTRRKKTKEIITKEDISNEIEALNEDETVLESKSQEEKEDNK